MKFLALLVAASLASAGLAQTIPQRTPVPIRMEIRHADPWFVKAMLEGRGVVSPELSTVFGFLGFPPSTGDTVNSLFKGGRLVVNPTDNSLWFFPDWNAATR